MLPYLDGGSCVTNWCIGLVFLLVALGLLPTSEWKVVVLAVDIVGLRLLDGYLVSKEWVCAHLLLSCVAAASRLIVNLNEGLADSTNGLNSRTATQA